MVLRQADGPRFTDAGIAYPTPHAFEGRQRFLRHEVERLKRQLAGLPVDDTVPAILEYVQLGQFATEMGVSISQARKWGFDARKAQAARKAEADALKAKPARKPAKPAAKRAGRVLEPV